MRDLGDLNITDASHGAAFTVRIVPQANKTEIVGIEDDGTVKIRLAAPPVEGQVNQALVNFLADYLRVGPDQIDIMAEQLESRKMLISVLNVKAEDVERLLKAGSSSPSDEGD